MLSNMFGNCAHVLCRKREWFFFHLNIPEVCEPPGQRRSVLQSVRLVPANPVTHFSGPKSKQEATPTLYDTI
jgi:hypothetical protein